MAARAPRPRPVEHPRPAETPRPAPRPVERPQPHPAEHPASHPEPAVEHRQSDRPATHQGRGDEPTTPDRAPGHGGHPKTRPETKDKREHHEPTTDTGPDAGAAGADTSGELTGTDTQKEIEVLRQQVGDLQFGGTWQSADPPKLAARYGIALQGVEVGNSLRLAGRNFARKTAGAAASTTSSLTLVRNHHPPIYQEAKK